MADIIKTLLAPFVDPEIPADQREKYAVEYANATGMDAANTKAAKVFATGGPEAFVKHVFTDQESGKKLSYAEMRARYG